MARSFRLLAGAATLLWTSAAVAAVTGTSVYYQFDVIAQSGMAGLNGMGDSPSINDKGRVAFVGQVAGGELLYIGDGVNLQEITGFNPRTFGRAVQINDNDKVVARDQVFVPTFLQRIRIWDPNSIAIPPATIIARGGDPGAYDSLFNQASLDDADHVVFSALVGTQVKLVTDAFSGVGGLDLGTAPVALRPMIASTPQGSEVVVRSGKLVNSPIQIWSHSLSSPQDVATSADFIVLGQSPGISDDGVAVAFYGDLSAAGAARLGNGMTPGPGIFLSVDEGQGMRRLIRVAGEMVEDPNADPLMCATQNGNGVCDPGECCKPAAELGYDVDAPGSSIWFESFAANERVGVIHIPLGDVGIDDDCFVLAFMGQPNRASRSNPAVPGKPLFFSGNQGLWTLRVDVQKQLSPPMNRVYRKRSPIPVVQEGDTIAGKTVNVIGIYDPIANLASTPSGAILTQRRGDHRVAFWANTSGGQMIVRGTHSDQDQDGLLDHWETTGIDVDADGTVDLDLKNMGASVNKRDIFLEVDWLADEPDDPSKNPVGHTHKPLPGVITPPTGANGKGPSPLETMFNNAPALGVLYGFTKDGSAPTSIPKGITVHVDAGGGKDLAGSQFSRNMGMGPLDGGQQIQMPMDPTAHVDVVYFGFPGSLNVAGVNTLSFHDIKEQLFSKKDRRARELAFHYAVLADSRELLPSNSAPFIGDVAAATANTLTSAAPLPPKSARGLVKITAGPGMGQVRLIKSVSGATLTVTSAWVTIPNANSKFVVIGGSTGQGEVFHYPGPDYNSQPGNDFMVTMRGAGITKSFLGNSCKQWRTLAHELGHNLGLRHGGTDLASMKGDKYLSLMSYSWQLDCKSTPSPVQSYSTASDITYDDFANLQHAFFEAALHVGNSFKYGFSGVPEDAEPEDFTFEDAEALFGPLDEVEPAVTITALSPGAAVSPGDTLVVDFQAVDDVALASASATFDLDGDGFTDSPGEAVAATPIGPNTFRAVFGPITGPIGVRTLGVFGTDTSTNLGFDQVDIDVGGISCVPVDCDDGNPCTDDICSSGTCVHTDNTAPCDDGNACTQTDTCQGGVCIGSGVDPSCGPVCVTVQRGLFGAVDDALINNGTGKDGSTARNYGRSCVLTASLDAAGGQRQSLIRFDLSAIPAGATVVSAIATLYTSSFKGPVRVHQITAPWSELTVTWASFGGAFSPAVEATFPPSGLSRSVSLASLVQAWVNGSIPNNGVLLERDIGSTSFVSSDCLPNDQRPKLEVCYLPAVVP